jgi:general secretion pathway protein G
MKPLAEQLRDAVALGFAIGVLVLLCSLWWLSPKFGSSHAVPVAAARTQLSVFKTALYAFEVDNGFYPTGLQALVQQPAGATNWHGPYLFNIPRDPWGRDYVYVYPARQSDSTSPFELRSLGPPAQNAPIVLSSGLTHAESLSCGDHMVSIGSAANRWAEHHERYLPADLLPPTWSKHRILRFISEEY